MMLGTPPLSPLINCTTPNNYSTFNAILFLVVIPLFDGSTTIGIPTFIGRVAIESCHLITFEVKVGVGTTICAIIDT
jgi:hypothetical protein